GHSFRPHKIRIAGWRLKQTMKTRASLATLAVAAAIAASAAAADDAAVKKDLTAVIALQGLPCGQVTEVRTLGDNDYIASCQDGNRYHVFVNAQARVVAKNKCPRARRNKRSPPAVSRRRPFARAAGIPPTGESAMGLLRFPALLTLALTVTVGQAQISVRVRGTITGIEGNVLSVKSRDGRDLRITLADNVAVSVAKGVRFEG